MTVRLRAAVCALAVVGATLASAADPASDAPEVRVAFAVAPKQAPTYAASLQLWRSAEDVNDWIGARFEYDTERALRLSETQRANAGPLPIPPRRHSSLRRRVSASTCRALVLKRCARSSRAASPPIS